jgi:hypothetical protein
MGILTGRPGLHPCTFEELWFLKVIEQSKAMDHRYFVHTDFYLRQLPGCPVKDCRTLLTQAPFRGKEPPLPYCETHGIRLHGLRHKGRQTFAYCDQDNVEARLRNFCFEKDFVRKWILTSQHKAETHRLGFEHSEDAVTWNVFVSLLRAGRLSKVMSWLAGREISGTPELYLWGCHINLDQTVYEPYNLLKQARAKIEPDITRFLTEPDIMLVVPGKFLMCIEAKFTSGNTLAIDNSMMKDGEKPKSKVGLLNRYLFQNHYWVNGFKYIDPEKIGKKFHSQLFRNIVFAAGMAEKFNGDWQVVNLVRALKPSHQQASLTVDFDDPTEAVQT